MAEILASGNGRGQDGYELRRVESHRGPPSRQHDELVAVALPAGVPRRPGPLTGVFLILGIGVIASLRRKRDEAEPSDALVGRRLIEVCSARCCTGPTRGT